MRYDQVNHALTFLTKPGDMITLQVPYHEDVDLVVRHITNVMGRPRKWVKPNIMVYPNGIIHLESVCSNPLSGFAQDCLFFIDRDHDRSYMDWLEDDGATILPTGEQLKKPRKVIVWKHIDEAKESEKKPAEDVLKNLDKLAKRVYRKTLELQELVERYKQSNQDYSTHDST